MRVQVQKWGNSLALRIPRAFAVESQIDQGSEVELSLVKGQLIVTRIKKPTYSLEGLLEGVTEENLHGEIDTGPSIGQEAW